MREKRPRGALATIGREALAFARQAWLLRHDAARPVTPTDVAPGDDVVVFLHGLFATAGVLRPLRAAVTRHPGVHAAALTYAPGPGVEEIAARLAELVASIPGEARVHLVGHSMGGIVARFFVQERAQERAEDRVEPRVAQTISLASPFAGVPRVGMLGFDGARDLEPQSPLLRRVLLGGAASSVPHLSIVAGGDTLVRSPIAHAFPGGEVVVMQGRGHNALLFDEETAHLVERRVLARRAALRGG